MANGLSGANLKSLGVLWDFGTFSGLDDRELLARFVERRDVSAEPAFEVLVRRHGPMVLGVCQSLLGDRHAAEDAFQAVFLILARKARSILRPEQLGPWLYGVALKTARESRKREEKRRRLERRGPDMQSTPTTPPDHALLKVEEAEALHGEIARLPERYRVAIVLCDLEGLTQQEAAGRLRCPTGTIAIRLKRARERLKERLGRRGLAPSTSLLTMMDPRPEIAPGLIDATVKASMASGFATASVLSLAEGVRLTMILAKWKTATLGTVLVLGLSATWAASGGRAEPKPDDPPPPISQRRVAQAVTPEVRDYEDFVGRTEASGAEEILARVGGYLERIHAPDGKQVKKGELLFELGRKHLEDSYVDALKRVSDAETARDLAKAARDRLLPLPLEDRKKPWNEIDEASFKLARAERVVSAVQKLADGSAERLALTSIKAPFDGEISRPLVKIGELIQPGKRVLATIVSPDRAAISFEIDERTFLKLRFATREELAHGKVDVPVQASLADEENFPRSGTVQFLGDSLDPATGTARLRGVIDNTDRLIVPGMFVRVRLSLKDPHPAPIDPKAAIKADETDPQAIPERTIARAVTREVRDYDDLVGVTGYSRKEGLPAKISGVLEKANVELGARVKANDVLFEIDPTFSQRVVKLAEADLEQAEAQQKLARAVQARNARLLEKDPNFVSRPEIDKAAADLLTTQQSLDIAREAALKAKAALSETRIKAPFDGIIAEKNAVPGNLIKAGDALAWIVVLDPVVATFLVPQPRIDQLRRLYGDDRKVIANLTVRVRSQFGNPADINEYPHQATLESLPNTVDPATNTGKFQATFPNTDHFKSAMLLKVRMWFGPPHDALLVPEAAIATEGNREHVYILDDGDVVWARPVQVGRLHDGFRVIVEGLKVGDRVVVEDLASLKPGTTIKPRLAPKPDR